MPDRPFAAYAGDDPYVFVSYAHADAEFVYPELGYLAEQGANLWYDEGITPGSRWSDALANALERCAYVVFYVTPQSAASRNCVDEISFALERNKPLLAVYMESTALPPGLSLRLGSRQAIMQYELGQNSAREKVMQVLAQVISKPTGGSSLQATPASLTHYNQMVERRCSSIATIPLEYKDPELADLAETLMEGIEDSFIPAWKRMVGTSETTSLQQQGLTPAAIAKASRAGIVASGNIRQRGDDIRLSLELTDDEGNRFWSKRFDALMPKTQLDEDRFLNPICNLLRREIGQYQGNLTTDETTDNLGPWSLYARHRFARAAERRMMNLTWLRRAIELDSGENRFKSELALRLAGAIDTGFSKNPDADHAEALALARDCATSQNWLVLNDVSGTFGFLREFERSVVLARRCLESAPSSDNLGAKWQLSFRLGFVGEVDEAIALQEELDELMQHVPNPHMPNDKAHLYLLRGDVELALKEARAAVAHNNNPTQPFIPLLQLANIAATMGHLDEATDAIRQVRTLIPKFRIENAIKSFTWSYQKPEHQALMTGGLKILMDLEVDDDRI